MWNHIKRVDRDTTQYILCEEFCRRDERHLGAMLKVDVDEPTAVCSSTQYRELFGALKLTIHYRSDYSEISPYNARRYRQIFPMILSVIRKFFWLVM